MMTRRYKLILMFIGIAAITITSCKKALDINVDPNTPSLVQLTPKLVFPAGVASAAGRIGGDLAIVGGIWAQFYTQGTTSNQYKDIDAYNLTRGFGSTNTGVAWVELYSGALNDFQFVKTKSAALKDWNYYLMGTVMKAYVFQVLVDMYDMVPYSEAFQGASNLQPKFDDGYSVYKAILAELDTALSKDFTLSSNSSPGRTDFIFPKEESAWRIDPWIKFANTLKLKMYLRMVYAKPAEADAGIRALYTTGGANFLNQDASMNVFEDAPDKRNPLYTYNFVEIGTDANLRASMTVLSWLQANSDPRIDNYFSLATNSTGYSGINQGDYSNPAVALNSASKPKVNPTDPVDFISLAESNFLQAEALERYFAGAGAKAKYDAGVSASFARYGDAPAPFLATGGKYVYPVAGNFEQKLEAIIVQKWASMLNTHPLEAFFEKNRTTYPRTSAVYSDNAAYVPGQFVYAKNGVTNGLFPKRLIFPDLETSKNSNAPADEPVTKKVWWDVR